MPRSVWKGPFVRQKLLKKVENWRKEGKSRPLNIYYRDNVILPQFVGVKFGVYNGHKFIEVLVTEEMVGHKFGEFSATRTYYGHGEDKKKRK